MRPGDALMVHSSFDRFLGFTGTITDAVAALQDAVGPDGTVLMPTMPFDGSALDYAASGKVFDVRRTPSRMGLLTEMFRRSPGVTRSVHPTHSVAVWGAKAELFVADHHRAGTPCGRGTPWYRLWEQGGKSVLLGTAIGSMTFFHTAEEVLEPEMPFSPFTAETFLLHSKDWDGQVLETRTRLFDRDVSGRRDVARMVPALKQAGSWREGRVGRLSVTVLEARPVLEVLRALARDGVFCYK